MENRLSVLYHGSGIKLEELVPKKASCFNTKEGNLIGVYATRLRNYAIAIALYSSKGDKGIGTVKINGRKAELVIEKGYPKQEFIYVYTLNTDNFENIPQNSHQYISFVPVKPVKIEKLKTSDYLHIIRKANSDEKRIWRERIKNLNKI